MRLVLTAILLGLGVAPAWAREFTLAPRWIAGGTGSSPGEYGIPESVAIDSLGRVVATDKGRMMLHVYDARDGRPLFDVGQLGSEPLEFDRPNGIAVHGDGRILVVEQRNQRVQILDRDYGYVGSFGHAGIGPGTFQKAMGIAVDDQGRIYVTDEARADVQVFDAAGRYLWKFGDTPTLRRVESIEVHAASGRIFVCDESRSLVNVYDFQGRFLHAFGGPGSGPGQFGDAPNAVRLDGRGRIYVNDQGNARINVYRPDTSFLASFRASTATMESADGVALSEVHDLFIVADQGHDRLLAFELGEIQCRLADIELERPAAGLYGLRVCATGAGADSCVAPWADAPLGLEVRASGGDAAQVESAIVHVRSRRDPGGVCVQVVETAPGSDLLRGTLQLAEHSDETSGRLATFDSDTLRVHRAGQPDEIVLEVAPLGPPLGLEPTIDGRPADTPHTSPAPLFAWRFVDPAGRRPQTACQLDLRRRDGTLWWSSGVRLQAETRLPYDGPEMPPGEALELELRVATGRHWSAGLACPVRRNVPPPAPVALWPTDGALLPAWPVALRARAEADADGEPLRWQFEIWGGRGRRHVSPPVLALDDLLTWLPIDCELAENDSLRWRIVAHDGRERSPSPWRIALLDAEAERPRPPQPIAPRDAERVHGAAVELRWEGGRDPDPRQTVRHVLEWCQEGSDTWIEEPLTTDGQRRWQLGQVDGVLRWRLRAVDPTGLSSLGPERRLVLQRSWQARLQVTCGSETSDPLLLGIQPGAAESFALDEDSLAVRRAPGLEIGSRLPEAPAVLLSADIRPPRSPAEAPPDWWVVVRGPAGAWVDLHLRALTAPEGWALRLLDAAGTGLGDLSPGAARRLRLGDTSEVGTGEALVRLRLVAAASQREPVRIEPAGASMTASTEAHPNLDRLPNPVHLGTRLQLAAAGAAARAAEVYDVRGRRLRSVKLGPDGSWVWDGRDGRGRALAPGIYVLSVRTATGASSRKLIWPGR